MTDITLFILNKDKRIIDVVSNAGTNENVFYDDKFIREINVASTFEFTLAYNDRTSQSIKAGNHVMFKYHDKYYLFTIATTDVDDTDGYAEAEVYCESISLILYNSVMQKTTINNCNATILLNTILQDTDFKTGYVDPEVDKNAALIEIDKTKSIYEILTDQLETFKAEMDIRIEVDGNKVTGMYIDLYSKLGSNKGARFEYGTNLENVKRKEDVSELCTAIIGVGKNELDFREVEWSIAAGQKANKPRGANFVADNMANAIYGTPDKYIYGIYEDGNCEDPWTLLEKSYESLLERRQPKIDYECNVAYIDGDIDLGDSVNVVDRTYPEPLMLNARVNKIELSFSDDSNDTCEFANYNKAYSNMITKNDTLEELKNYILGLNIGKLTLAEIEVIKQYMSKLGIDKETIDKLFAEIIDDINKGSTVTPGEVVNRISGGLWIGDSRMVAMKKHNLFKVDESDSGSGGGGSGGNTDAADYKTALALYQSIGTGDKVKTYASKYESTISSSNKYKISTLVKYWAAKFGLDVNLVYAFIIQESGADPYNATKSSNGGYGLMQCERQAYFQGYAGTSAQSMTYIDGTKKTFYPSYSNMTPGQGGTTTISGIVVDKNISNQVMFGCSELRKAIDYAHGNIFAGLISYNMGVGAMYWIVSRYVCDTYGYTFVNKRSIKAQSAAAQKKIYEVLENGGFEFANWRQVYMNNGGKGTVNNVELYLKWYKIENGQLPYIYDKDGNKFGYGVSGKTVAKTNYSASSSNAVVTYATNTQLTPTRRKIVDKAKEIVQLHIDKKASYSQVPRTIDDTKRKYIKKGSRAKVNSRGKYQTIGSSYFGVPTSANDGKGVIGYDCSSFASCCYMNAGLKSLYNGNCSGGSIMNEIVGNGGMMWLANAEGRKKAKPGDCIMFASGKNPTQNDMNKRKFISTHHIGVYIGDDQMAHASQWAQHPNAIKISKLSTYKTLASAFFIRPKDLQETDKNESTVEDTATDVGNNIVAKCVIGASAYHFYSGSQLKKVVQVGSYSDTTEYPSDPPYIFVHLGVNDPYQSGYSSLKTLLSLLRTKYPTKPIFVARELHVGSNVSNYVDFNKAIDTFNAQIAEYCNNHEKVYQIDISTNLEESGVLKSSITADGIHLKTKADYQVLFNNITSKIKYTKPDGTESSGDDSGESGGDSGESGGTTPVNYRDVEQVLYSTNNYYYSDTLGSLYFKLPSKVVDSYYSRLKFTTSPNFKYTQSKIAYLEGEDCVAGQLTPRPNTTYKIIIMANANDSINYKYYGSVTVIKSGGYSDPYTFAGGSKVVEIAKTYYNQSGLEYRGQYSTTAKYTPATYANPYANLSKWYDSTRKKGQIDCSTLTKYTYMGIDYDHSPYANHKMTSVKRNTSYSWAFTFPRTAAEQAEYCVKNGWVLHDVDTEKYSNLEPGDLIFWDRDNKENGRYMNCSHSAICVGEIDGVVNTIESTTCENGVKIRPITENTADKILFVARPKKA